MYARVAWTLTALTVLVAIGDVSITAAYRPLLSEETVAVHGFPLVTGAAVGSAAMGALIVSRYARHPIGWLLCLTGFAGSISLLTEAYYFWVLKYDGPGPRSLGHVAGWVSVLLGGQLIIGALAIMFLVAPDGRFLSRRWRYAGIAPLVGLGCVTAGLLTVSPTEFDIDSYEVGPVGSMLSAGGLLLITGGLIASAVSMIRRLRLSQGVQRQQLRLIAAAAIFAVVGLVWEGVYQLFNGGHQTWAASLPLFVSYLCLPILFGIAVLHYRLYDIEVIINRAVIVAVGTVFAAIGYTGLVVAVAAVVNTETSGFWLSLLATSLVALAFQPLRQRVVRFANRLAYGSRALPYEALADFSRRLTETPSPQTLLPAVAEAAGHAVSAASSTSVLRVPGAGDMQERWPAGTPHLESEYEVPVRHGGDTLGSIGVTMPKGRRLRAVDERLLHDLADQTAQAFRNAAIEAELAQHVAALDRTTQALTESRRRIIAANDAARRQLESAISREVLPHIATMPAQLGRLSVVASGSAALDELEQLVTRTNTALESLRELTRGVFPTQLARSGVVPALRSHLARSCPRTALYVAPSADRRFPARVEAAVYFCCVEALRADSGSAGVDLLTTGRDLVVRIRGFARDEVDVQAIVDRVEAAGGTPYPGDSDTLSISIPLGDDAAATAGRRASSAVPS